MSDAARIPILARASDAASSGVYARRVDRRERRDVAPVHEGRRLPFDRLAHPVIGLEDHVADVHFELSGPTLSSHLTILRTAGLVDVRVDGDSRRYRCNQDAVRALVPLLATSDERWHAAHDIPERQLATAGRSLAVVVAVNVPIPPGAAFEAFADGDRYSEWLGVPVRIRGGRFRATLEWGTEIRGTYDVVSPPDLIAMRWDFDDDNIIPLPGREPGRTDRPTARPKPTAPAAR